MKTGTLASAKRSHSECKYKKNSLKLFPDSYTSSHPVSVPINDPSHFFDEVSYKKGASIIRMIANILGLDVFNRGIQHYLTKHQYGNAKQVKRSTYSSQMKIQSS